MQALEGCTLRVILGKTRQYWWCLHIRTVCINTFWFNGRISIGVPRSRGFQAPNDVLSRTPLASWTDPPWATCIWSKPQECDGKLEVDSPSTFPDTEVRLLVDGGHDVALKLRFVASGEVAAFGHGQIRNPLPFALIVAAGVIAGKVASGACDPAACARIAAEMEESGPRIAAQLTLDLGADPRALADDGLSPYTAAILKEDPCGMLSGLDSGLRLRILRGDRAAWAEVARSAEGKGLPDIAAGALSRGLPIPDSMAEELLGYCFQAELPLLTLRVLARIDGKRFLMPALQRARSLAWRRVAERIVQQARPGLKPYWLSSESLRYAVLQIQSGCNQYRLLLDSFLQYLRASEEEEFLKDPCALPRDRGGAECPICLEPLCRSTPVAFVDAADAAVCLHLLCSKCARGYTSSTNTQGEALRCPECRRHAITMRQLPSLSEDPLHWFEFLASDTVSVNGKVAKSMLLRTISSILPVEADAIEAGRVGTELSQEVSASDFLTHELFVWVWRNVQEHLRCMKLGPPPDLEERRAWFKYWNLSESGRLSRAEVLRAILRSFRVSSTDRQKLQELRARVDKVWDLWHSNRLAVQGHADPNFVSCEEFARDGGFGDLLNEMFGLDPGGHDLHPAPPVEASSVSRRHAGQRRQPHGVPSPRGWRPAPWDGRPGSAGHLTRPLPGPTAFAATGSAGDGPPPDLEVPSETVAPPGMFEASPLARIPVWFLQNGCELVNTDNRQQCLLQKSVLFFELIPWTLHRHSDLFQQSAEEQWVALMSLDGDLLVESLSNLPVDLQGRLEQVVEHSSQVRDAQDRGLQVIVDTNLGTATWRLHGDSTSTEEEDVPQPAPSRSWADQTEAPQTQQALVQQAPAPQTTQPGLAQAQAAMPTLQPLSKKGTGKGKQSPPVKAMPQPAPAQPQTMALTQVPCGQPPAKAPTVSPPPSLSALVLQATATQADPAQPQPQAAQTATAKAQSPAPVADPPLQQPQPALQPGTRGAFPNDLVGYNAGCAKWAAVGAQGLLPQAEVLEVQGTMASVSDSTVTFKAKALQHGVPEESLTAWVTDGIQTYSQLLFRVASAPNAIDSGKLDSLLKGMKPPATDSVASAVNRLLFEAGTFVVAELRSSLEQPSSEPTRRLSTQERSSRLQVLQSKLGSFRISGQYEPSHQLVDAFSSMISDQSVRHVPLNRCSCREQEVSNVKKVDLSTELRVAQALSRRGLAMEMAGIGPPPPKFDAPGIDSAKAAAIDNAIKNWQHSMQVAYFLVPVPKPEKPEKQPFKRTWDQSFAGDKGGKGKGKGKFMQQAWQAGKSGKGKSGKGKDKTQTSLPAALKGLDPNFKGQPICFNHSLPHGCSEETWQTDKIHFGTFDSCVYGGARRKATTFWSSAQSVTALTLRCHPGLKHVRLPWGKSGSVWSTAEEAAYPQALCRHWAALLTQELVDQNRLEAPGLWHGTQRFAAAERASLGLFPKATHAPVTVDPFQGQQWAKLDSDSDRTKFVPGVRLQAAVTSQHPACSLPPLPEALERTVNSLSSRSLSEIHKLRCQRLRSLCDMAKELQEQEDADHSQLQPHMRDILKGKRLRLFDTILQGIGFPDKQLVRDMRSGFRITGWLPDTDTRPSKVVPPVMHRDEVWENRQKHNQQIWSQCKPSADPKLDRELWEQSLKECAQGWATLETGHTQAPENCVLGRRFPVVQGDKTRPIDDLSISSVNSSLGSDEKIVVQPSSSTISLALHIQSRCLSSRRRASQPAGMKGRTFDLKTAFKQLGIATEDLPFAKVSVWNPDAAAPAVLALKALPFGATGSVHGFSRCSLAIWQIAVSLLLLPLTVFFDDYTSVTVAEDSIAYILPRTPSGFVRVSNTEGRKQEVTATCQRALASGTFSPAECLAFAGRLRWLDAQIFGRKGRWAFRTILEHGTRPGRNRQLQLSPQLRDALVWVQQHVPTAKPRAFKRPPTKAYNVFTDGSFEAGLGRIGGVLCSPTGQLTEWFQATVPQDIVQSWLDEGTSHPILQCEMLAVCVAAALWGSAMAEWSELQLPWEGGTFGFVSEERTFLDDLQDSQAERQAALSKWSPLLRAVPHFFQPETVSEIANEDSCVELGNLDLRFAKKSTNTLLNRVSSLQRLAAWTLKAFPHEPLSEPLVFLYCQHVTSQQPSSSAPDQLCQALNFSEGSLGLQVPAARLVSPKVQGLAHQSLRKQKPSKQAPALSTDQVRWLQSFSVSDESQHECYLAATFLFMVYARARHSDVKRSQKLIIDRDDAGQAWAERWLELRSDLGLRCEGSLSDSPLLPELAADGSLLPVNMDSATASRWLRCLLAKQPGSNADDILKMSSQGLKATCLSWTMKAGIPDGDQTLLGYHSRGKSSSAMSYGRQDVGNVTVNA
ncbi:slc10a7 [Symbiodinium sp. CCMP2592]|nr:slc10a7 [Symbiodinium sp. CCMP2592]